MRTVGIALLIVLITLRISSANESSLGDRRLFFSEQERQAMESEGKGSGTVTPESGNETGAVDKSASVSIATQSPRKLLKKTTDQHPAFVVNGFIEASEFLTLFVNGKPCEKLSLHLNTPQKFNCSQLAGQPLTTVTLERMGKRHIAIRAPDGKLFKLARRGSK